MSCKFVAYYRVSTQAQGQSGLGLDAQKLAVAQHVAANEGILLAAYTEIETAKKHSLDNRPALSKAIKHAKRSKAVLVVAKLDRLLRSTVVCAMLKTSGVKFEACDNPHANPLTIDILAAVAEDEVRRISERTVSGLRVLKARGVALGSHRPECAANLTAEAARVGRAMGAQRVRELAVEAYSDVAEMIANLRSEGQSLRAIAEAMNREGQTTRTGKPWNPVQISRVLDRAA